MQNDSIIICNSIKELQQGVRHLVGGTSALHFSERSLRKLKDEAIADKHMLHSATVDCAAAGGQASLKRRMQLNGPIAARNSIINKIDSLLKAKGI
jgi:hypothetical protein